MSPRTFLSPAAVAFGVALLTSCLTGQVVFWGVAVLGYGPHWLAALAGVGVQLLAQRVLAARAGGERRWRVHLLYGTLTWAMSVALYAAGGAAFFVQATAALTVMLAGGLACALMRGSVRASLARAVRWNPTAQPD